MVQYELISHTHRCACVITSSESPNSEVIIKKCSISMGLNPMFIDAQRRQIKTSIEGILFHIDCAFTFSRLSVVLATQYPCPFGTSVIETNLHC